MIALIVAAIVIGAVALSRSKGSGLPSPASTDYAPGDPMAVLPQGPSPLVNGATPPNPAVATTAANTAQSAAIMQAPSAATGVGATAVPPPRTIFGALIRARGG